MEPQRSTGLLPPEFPTLDSFLALSDKAIQGEIFNPTVSKILIDRVESLLTPESIIFGTEFNWEPEMIHPSIYSTFDILLRFREELRTLKLVPVKWPDDREYYHLERDGFIQSIVAEYAKYPMTLAPNLYKDALPDDTEQYILWMRDRETTQREIAEFLAGMMMGFQLSTSDIIFFERPLNTSQTLIRGTVKDFRHVHVLIRRKEC